MKRRKDKFGGNKNKGGKGNKGKKGFLEGKV
jgi:hypothetical protein